MRFTLIFFAITLVLGSCSSTRKLLDVGEDYSIEFDQKNPTVEVYRSSSTNRKFQGEILRRATGKYDTTLQFTLIGSFKNGVLHGADSTFRNDTLIRVEQYRKGLKHGDQIELDDFERIVSPYENDVIHGFQSTFDINQLVKKSYFNHGIKDSVEFFYDSTEQIVTTFNYHFDLSEYWESHLDLENHQLVSYSYFSLIDTLTLEQLQRAEYRGTIYFNGYDPNHVGYASPTDVVHESIVSLPSKAVFRYFYVIDKDMCKVCDYIDDEEIWVAYFDGIQLVYYELRTF